MDLKKELTAIRRIDAIIKSLDINAQQRVLDYATKNMWERVLALKHEESQASIAKAAIGMSKLSMLRMTEAQTTPTQVQDACEADFPFKGA